MWQGYISTFRAPAKLLSDSGAKFENNIISELCELMGNQKVRTLPYHPRLMDWWSKRTTHWCRWLENWVKIRRQTGLSIYQNCYMLTIPQDWPSHDTAHTIWCLGDECAYLSPFIFPQSQTQKSTSMLITMLLSCVSNCAKPSGRHKCSPHLRLKGRGNTMIIKLMPFHWNQATWFWQKLMPTRGGERWKTGRRRNHTKWNTELLKVSLLTSWKTSRPDTHESSTGIDFSHYPHNGGSFMFRCVSWVDKVCHYHPGGAYSESEWEWGNTRKCELSAAGPVPDKWDSSRVGQ